MPHSRGVKRRADKHAGGEMQRPRAKARATAPDGGRREEAVLTARDGSGKPKAAHGRSGPMRYGDARRRVSAIIQLSSSDEEEEEDEEYGREARVAIRNGTRGLKRVSLGRRATAPDGGRRDGVILVADGQAHCARDGSKHDSAERSTGTGWNCRASMTKQQSDEDDGKRVSATQECEMNIASSHTTNKSTDEVGEEDHYSANRKGLEACAEGALHVEMLWNSTLNSLNRLNPKFFTTDDAKLLRTSNTWRKGSPYDGVNATISNCLALRKIYDVFYRAKELQGVSSVEGFQRLSFTISQFLRLCIARLCCTRRDVYKVEILFRCVSNMESVKCFMDFALERRSPRTVLRKAKHLRMVCRAAPEFMNNDHERSCLQQVSRYLHIIIDGNRNNVKHSVMRTEFSHLPMTLLKRVKQAAVYRLHDEISWYKSKRKEKVPVTDLHQLVTRWMYAFVAFLVICSGGQNPQAITHIQIPCRGSFKEDLREAFKAGFIGLPTLCGKRTLALGLPEVILPGIALPFIQFHVSVILPTIDSITKRTETKEYRLLLVNKETGMGMNSATLAYSLRKFVSEVDPRFSNVTCRDLRYTAMSFFLQAYRQNRLYTGITEAKFLDITARYFNTTATQLRSTVGFRGSTEHRTTAEELTWFLSKVSGD